MGKRAKSTSDSYEQGRNQGWAQANGSGEYLAEHSKDPEYRQGAQDGKELRDEGYNADGTKLR